MIRTTLIAAALNAASAFADDTRPNLVLILADDMGFSDIGPYGGEIRTPTLDTLAGKGVRFTQFYNGARCCPTRAALLTGLYAHQAGQGHMTTDESGTKGEGFAGGLNNRCVTLPQVLRTAGYRTYMAGKWHIVAGADAPGSDPKGWPMQRGFDRFFGTLHGSANYWTGMNDRGGRLMTGNTYMDAPAGFYMTDNIGDSAAGFINDHYRTGPAAGPFFLYAAFTAPHWPLHAHKADIDKYRTRYRGGWEALRAERHARQKRLGIVDAAWPLTDPDAPDWESLTPAMRDTMALKMAVYAAQIDNLDRNIGKLTAALRNHGALDKTLIIFLSDNGACAEGGNFGFGPHRQLETQEGFNLSYGQGWAHAGNTPFSQYKHYTREGGISAPFIAHWPDGIKAAGSIIREHGHLIDVMPTFLEAAGAAYPKAFQGNLIPPMEGKSLIKAFAGGAIARSAPLFWEHEGNKAVRDGKWKLLSNGGAPWRLFDMEADRTELNDLAGANVARVSAMDAAWIAWSKRAYAVKPDAPTPTRLEIVAPAAGEEIRSGTAYPILWGATTDSIANVKLWYQVGNGAWNVLTEGTPRGGGFTWTVPGAATGVRVRISSVNDKFKDTTGAFTILPPVGTRPAGAAGAELPAIRWRMDAEGIRFIGLPPHSGVKVFDAHGRTLFEARDAGPGTVWRRTVGGGPSIRLIQVRSRGTVRAYRGLLEL